MLKRLLKIFVACLAALLLAGALGLAVITLWPESLRSTLEWALSPAGGRATIQALDFSPTSQTLELRGLRLGGAKAGEMDVAVETIAVRANVWGAILGEPPLRSVIVRGLVVDAALGGGEGDSAAPPGWLWAMEAIHVDATRIKLAWPWVALAVEDLSLEFTGGGNGKLDLRASVNMEGADKRRWFSGALEGKAGVLSLSRASFDTPWLQGAVNARLGYELTKGRLNLRDIALSLPDATAMAPVGGKKLRWSGLNASLKAGGQYDIDKGQLNIKLDKLAIAGLADVSGNYSPTGLTAKGAVQLGPVLLDGLRPLLPTSLQGLSGQGRLAFDLNRGSDGSSKLAFTPKDLTLSLPEPKAEIVFGGALGLAGLDDAWQWSGALTALAAVGTKEITLKDLRLNLPLSGPLARPVVSCLTLAAPPGTMAWQGRALPLGRVSASADLLWRDDLPTFDNLALRSEALGGLHGRLALAAEGPQGELNGENIKAAGVVALAGAIAPDSAKGWQAQGGVDLALAIKPKGGGTALDLTLAPRGLALQSADGLFMLAELKGKVELGAAYAKNLRLRAGLSLEAGQFLYDTVYLDLAKRPLNLEVSGLRQAARLWRDMLLDLRVGGLGSLRLSGSLDGTRGKPNYNGHLNIKDFEVGPAFAELVRPNLSARQPELALMQMGGTANLGLDIRGQGGVAAISGRLSIGGGWLSPDGQTRSIDGLDLGLPLSYELGGQGKAKTKIMQWGRLRLAKLSAGALSLEKLNLTLALAPNQLVIREALSLPLYGANLRISPIKIDQPLSKNFTARMRASLSRLDLSALPTGALMLQGNLGGDLSPVELTTRGLSCGGALKGRFFGGNLVVDNIVARELFSGVPVFGADALARNVDLKSFTTALGAGVVSGRVDIELKNLRIASGQPQAFDLRVRSRETTGVTQEVSLQAVNSISVIGTGEGLTSLGMGLIQPLFERFSYEAIGFSCTLRNDIFTVRGLIRDGDVEYIVRKPPFFGINVINANKDNQISFSDMLGRVRRVAAERAAPADKE